MKKTHMALAAALFVVSSLSFALGYFADRTWNRAPIIIEKCPSP